MLDIEPDPKLARITVPPVLVDAVPFTVSEDKLLKLMLPDEVAAKTVPPEAVPLALRVSLPLAPPVGSPAIETPFAATRFTDPPAPPPELTLILELLYSAQPQQGQELYMFTAPVGAARYTRPPVPDVVEAFKEVS